MPFTLSSKPSKAKLRKSIPSPLDLSHDQPLPHVSSLPTTPHTADALAPASGSGGFKMFSWKKRSSSTSSNGSDSPRPYYPAETPRPILKSPSDDTGGANIRFAGDGSRVMPRVVVSDYDPQVSQPRPSYESRSQSWQPQQSSPGSISRGSSPRRSSRPTSPATTSFGTRVRTSGIGPLPHDAQPLNTPPLHQAQHITTPPTAYVSSMQTRAPPPPSPYRPTTNVERRRSVSVPLPSALPMTTDINFAPRPPRHSSLWTGNTSESMQTLNGMAVPMLNIIPATPQENYEEFGVIERRNRLDEAHRVVEGDMEEIPLDANTEYEATPRVIPNMMDVNLEFSPFSPLPSLPSSSSLDLSYEQSSSVPTCPLPPSPPFESYPSLPSLSSHASMPSSGSEDSMPEHDQEYDSLPTSSSDSSLASFPDVEEALGSMLASLSDINVAYSPKKMDSPNHGLGLGLDLPDISTITTHTHTAPLSPRRRGAPPPLDLSFAKNAPPPERQTAPPGTGFDHSYRHRIAFYGTARAAPNSPTSGVFTLTGHSPSGSLELEMGTGGVKGFRDSMSLTSEASDDDLYTASIISLTPVVSGLGLGGMGLGGRIDGDRAVLEVGEEVMLGLGLEGLEGDVGLAL